MRLKSMSGGSLDCYVLVRFSGIDNEFYHSRSPFVGLGVIKFIINTSSRVKKLTKKALETFDDLKQAFLDSVDRSSIRVLKNEKIIFLCGGKLDSPNKAQKTPASFRSFFYNKLTQSRQYPELRIILAEELSGWYMDAIAAGIDVKDILKFETQISYLSGLTCIILESAGAIAELGAFCVLPEFDGRILLIANSIEYEKNSFIKLGPIKLLENASEVDEKDYVFVYDWEIKHAVSADAIRQKIGEGEIKDMQHDIFFDPSEIQPQLNPDELDAIYNSVCDDINNALENMHKSEKLNIQNSRHLFLIAIDLVSLFQSIKFTEIFQMLESFGFEVSKRELKTCLFISVKLGLILKTKSGGTDFYIFNNSKAYGEYNFSAESGTRFDRAIHKMVVLEAIERLGGTRKAAMKTAARKASGSKQ